jgi:hypothetical protein
MLSDLGKLIRDFEAPRGLKRPAAASGITTCNPGRLSN